MHGQLFERFNSERHTGFLKFSLHLLIKLSFKIKTKRKLLDTRFKGHGTLGLKYPWQCLSDTF